MNKLDTDGAICRKREPWVPSAVKRDMFPTTIDRFDAF